MECITWFAPILPGKLNEWKAHNAEMSGPRREEHARSRKRVGVTREVASLMQTPQGDSVCLFHEAQGRAQAFQRIATSEDAYDVWFREQLVSLHGLTAEMLQGPVPATPHVGYRDHG